MISLEVHNLSCQYTTRDRSVLAVDRLDLKVHSGTFTAIVGASGCGKTTLLRLIAGLRRADQGSISFGGAADPDRRHHAALVFQDDRLLPWLTVRQNLLLALRREALGAPEREERLRAALELVKMERWGSAYPYQLSGGMAQRVNLARALCQRRSLWLLDEPFSALDAITRLQLQQELSRLWAAEEPTVLLVTHDISEAVLLADRVLTMGEGVILHDRSLELPRPRRRSDPAFIATVSAIEESLLGTPGEEAPRQDKKEATP
ncbi:NitT/TauT family transport system ATP-binding protein/sulfonate transport system ATP-binding protein [Alkalispirochaeta americana]|uniref:NitT/TauT family transport system ATP-binding protein/sulfonate transport system ATP-binding protein n=1 Tax=Alkalispirochaeta americana TaxID=159291 RepID=A0A1N6T579_9SPIO|nr:ABC transporter ATP-binding protein [Alkalispirochaeta americana]SIQ48387.1 NitT/TauT family transport system ATP-binding protein/sulfonate transport system ATP-binding protein [Alkalispirochaeta americana]